MEKRYSAAGYCAGDVGGERGDSQVFVDTWNAGDMGAVRELLDPDVILMPVSDWPEPGPYMGREAAMGFYDAMYRWCRDATAETHNWPSNKPGA